MNAKKTIYIEFVAFIVLMVGLYTPMLWFSVMQTVRRHRLVREKRKCEQALSAVQPFSGYRSIPTVDFLALEERLAEVNARLAKIDNQLNGVLEKVKKHIPPAPTTKAVSINWEGLKQYLGWEGTIEELKRRKLPD